jgi:small subunit ribosomal protein S18
LDKKKEKKPKFRKRKKKICIFCAEKKKADYKDIEFIKRFITDRGKIAPRRSSGCCAKHQREIAQLIKRVRHLGLIPFAIE